MNTEDKPGGFKGRCRENGRPKDLMPSKDPQRPDNKWEKGE